MYINFKNITPTERYFAMVQSIIPRPIAWVLSDNGDNTLNLAPFSFFTGICSDPPLIMFSVGKKPSGDEKGQPKDTSANIREREKFVLHIASTHSLHALNETGATLNHGDSEIDKQKLKTIPFDGFSLPRLDDCQIAMACTLYRLDEIGNTPQSIIYGEIEKMYVCDTVLDSNQPNRLVIDAEKLDPLARLGGSFYCDMGKLLTANRPK